MRKYELTVIANPDNDSFESTDKIEALVFKNGGNIEKKEFDGKKRLAYKIMDYEFGIYVFYIIYIDQDKVNKLSRELDIEDCILRYLLVPTREK